MEPLITPKVIDRLKAGDLTAFDEMYSATKNKVYGTVYVLAPNKQEVDEIVNEIYFQVWKSILNYDATFPFTFWLNGLVFRQLKNWKLKVWKRMEIVWKIKKFSMKDSFVRDDVWKSQNQEWVYSMVDSMPYKLKEVLLLIYFYDYSLKEVADVLNAPIGTIKSRHHTAIKYLKKKYGHSIASREVGLNKC
jgi:RNA polymerase sigma-70 factor, ECF subfamily